MGTEDAADEVACKDLFVPDARLPKEPWRAPATEEVAFLLDRATEAAPGETLEIVSLTAITASQRAREALELGREVSTAPDVATTEAWDTLSALAADLLRAVTAGGTVFRLASEVRVHRDDPGLITTTRDPGQENRLLGLHVDSQERRRLSDRALCQRLLSVNIAAEPRWLLFVNASLSWIAQDLEQVGCEDIGRLNATDAGRIFLAGHIGYPVFRVRLEPGQGYLGPVQNMVHDGSTAGAHLPGLRACAFGEYSA
jgi:hypothetical protein